MKNIIDELEKRGMVHDMTPGVREQFNEVTTAYIGFDPTADSLHVGSLIQIMLLNHLSRLGHNPIALIGDATAMIGDPSGKSKERNLLDVFQVRKNFNAIEKQLEALVPGVEIERNMMWMKEFSFIDFIRDIGKNFSVNQMLTKDSVKNRIEGGGISFTEFSYQLLQAYDFAHLHKNMDCKVQMGGSDQWGNMTAGTDLIRKMYGKEAFAVTTPLLKKSDGGKIGKTESGTIWLSPEKTSPYEFYQFWLNTSDDDVVNFLRIFTFKSESDIKVLERGSVGTMQKELAKSVTCMVHGDEEFRKAKKASDILFGNDTLSQDLSVLEGVPTVKVDKGVFEQGLVEYLSGSVFESKGEVKRMVKQGGVKINRKKVEGIEDKFYLLQNKYLLVQRGKKKYHLLEVL